MDEWNQLFKDPANYFYALGAAALLGVWWARMTPTQSNLTVAFGVIAMGLATTFKVSDQPLVLRVLWVAFVVSALGLVSYYTLWSRPAQVAEREKNVTGVQGLTTNPCAAEIGRAAPVPPPVDGATQEQIPKTVTLRTDVYVEVSTVRFEKYSHQGINMETYALCAPIFILSRSATRLNLRFMAIEMNFPDRPNNPQMHYMAGGIETFNLQTGLAPGEQTTGCFRFLALSKEATGSATRFLWIKELNSGHWLRVPITGRFPPSSPA